MSTLQLLIDQGNTRAKFALFDRQNNIITRVDESELPIIKQRIVGVVAASVQNDLDIWLTSWLAKNQLTGINVNIINTPKHAFGVTVAYQEYTRLGVDRWLAILAAYSITNKPSVIADFGTALTIDVVDGAGQHQGGWILPGFNTTINALLNNTKKIEPRSRHSTRLELGQSTEACLYNGVLVSHLLPLQHACQQLAAASETEIVCIFTGGDAENYFEQFRYLIGELNCALKRLDDLVFIGLRHYCD